MRQDFASPRRSACDQPVNRQQDNGSHHGSYESCTLIGAVPADRLAEIGRYERAGDPQQDRYDEPSGIAARHQQFGNHADNQANQDCADNMQWPELSRRAHRASVIGA